MKTLRKAGRVAGRYAVNVLLSLDQLGNSLLGGDPDETISSRIGRIKLKWGGRIPRWRVLTRATDWILNRIERDHSIRAIEPPDRTRRAILDRDLREAADAQFDQSLSRMFDKTNGTRR